MRIGAVIQARMGSRRLPGKVLRELAGRPLLAHVLDRVGRVQRLDAIAVATSTEPSDDPIVDFCSGRGTTCVRGPMANVEATAWIAESAMIAARRWQPDLFYIYLPSLDYAAQRTGPDSAAAQAAVAELDEVIGRLAAGMAEAYYAEIAPHLYCGPIEAAANIQVGTCSPNFLIQESIETWGGFHAEILKDPIQWEDGYIIPPTKPGLGVELDEEVAAKNPYREF